MKTTDRLDLIGLVLNAAEVVIEHDYADCDAAVVDSIETRKGLAPDVDVVADRSKDLNDDEVDYSLKDDDETSRLNGFDSFLLNLPYRCQDGRLGLLLRIGIDHEIEHKKTVVDKTALLIFFLTVDHLLLLTLLLADAHMLVIVVDEKNLALHLLGMTMLRASALTLMPRMMNCYLI